MKKLLALALLLFSTVASAQFINQNYAVSGPNTAFAVAFGVDRSGGSGPTLGQLIRTDNSDAASPFAVTLIAEVWSTGNNVGAITGVTSHVINRNPTNPARKTAFQAKFDGAYNACTTPPIPPASNANSAVLLVESGNLCAEMFETLIDLSKLTTAQMGAINIIKFPDGKLLKYDTVNQTLYLQ